MIKLDRAKELEAAVKKATDILNSTIGKAVAEGLIIEVDTTRRESVFGRIEDCIIITVHVKIRLDDIDTST